MEKAVIAFSSVVIFMMLGIGCAPMDTDETKSKVTSEVWRAYLFDEHDSNLDTTLIKGTITKRKYYDHNGRLKTLTEFPMETGIYKKVTIFDTAENIQFIETYYDRSERYGIIEENQYDTKGNPIKKLVSDIDEGKRITADRFDIANEYNGDGYLVKSVSIQTDTSETYTTENTYNASGQIESSILRNHLGNLISEVRNTYRNGKLLKQVLILPDANKTKEIDIEYIDNLNRIETEQINGEVQRISDFRYKNDQLVEIVVDEAELRQKKVIFIDRIFQ